MDDLRFDALTRTLTERLPRRGVGGILGGLGLTTLSWGTLDAKKKKKKIQVCHSGQTILIPKKKKKKHLKHGDTLGACSTPTTTTPTTTTTPQPSACLHPGDSLQSAIDKAANGATLCLEAGTFLLSSPLVIRKDLKLIGRGLSLTTLKGNGTGSVVQTGFGSLGDPLVTVELQGLKITGGADTGGNGGGIQSIFTHLTLIECELSGNRTTSGGGGIQAGGSGSLTMTDCMVTDNEAVLPDGTGTYGGGILNVDIPLLMTGCTVARNTASFAAGVAIIQQAARIESCTIENSTITDNTAVVAFAAASKGFAGGLYIETVDGEVLVKDSVITNNKALGPNNVVHTAHGGGIYIWGHLSEQSVLRLENTIIRENETVGTGGGLYVRRVVDVIIDGASDISDNDPDNCDGAAVVGCTN
jgi:hypothetical protein